MITNEEQKEQDEALNTLFDAFINVRKKIIKMLDDNNMSEEEKEEIHNDLSTLHCAIGRVGFIAKKIEFHAFYARWENVKREMIK